MIKVELLVNVQGMSVGVVRVLCSMLRVNAARSASSPLPVPRSSRAELSAIG